MDSNHDQHISIIKPHNLLMTLALIVSSSLLALLFGLLDSVEVISDYARSSETAEIIMLSIVMITTLFLGMLLIGGPITFMFVKYGWRSFISVSLIGLIISAFLILIPLSSVTWPFLKYLL